jgi:hypothetical protein
MRGLGGSFAAAVAVILLTGPALADAIDGNWCHSDGRKFSIQGSNIVTPGGKHMQGNYSRHYYSNVPVAPERGAGTTAAMTLVNENTVHIRYGESNDAPEVWLRCSQGISAFKLLQAG